MSAFAWNAYNMAMDVELLPGNATSLERAFERIWADRFARIPVLAIRRARSDQACPEQWLGYLAAERSVDEYSSFWPLDQRRAVVSDSFRYHQKKGTRAALDRALGQMSLAVRTVEWFEVTPAREPYTFRLTARLSPQSVWRERDRLQAVRLVNAAKNAHTLLQQIDLASEGRVPIIAGMSFLSQVISRMTVPPVVPLVPDPLEGSAAIRFGMGLLSRITHRMGTS